MMRSGGNLLNRIMEEESETTPIPKVGDGATILQYSDRKAATVTFATDTLVIVKQDRAKVVKGSAHDGSAEYVYEPNPDAPEVYFMKVKKGKAKGAWRENGSPSGHGIRFGHRDEYYDPSF